LDVIAPLNDIDLPTVDSLNAISQHAHATECLLAEQTEGMAISDISAIQVELLDYPRQKKRQRKWQAIYFAPIVTRSKSRAAQQNTPPSADDASVAPSLPQPPTSTAVQVTAPPSDENTALIDQFMTQAAHHARQADETIQSLPITGDTSHKFGDAEI